MDRKEVEKGLFKNKAVKEDIEDIWLLGIVSLIIISIFGSVAVKGIFIPLTLLTCFVVSFIKILNTTYTSRDK